MENLGAGKWAKHMIDDTWSQAHALTMVDLNGDGRPEFVTGKRYMAHNGSDPGDREPLGIYWYEYRPAKDGSIEWIKHIVEYGAETLCETGASLARQPLSFDVRISTFQSAGWLVECQSKTRLSEEESLGTSPNCRYGFSRNCQARPAGS